MNSRLEITFDRELAVLRFLLRPFRRGPKPSSPPRTEAYLAALARAFGPLPADALAAEPPLVATVVLDATALTALARGNVRARAYLALAAGSRAKIVVPATSLLDPQVATIAAFAAHVVDVDFAIVRRAARLMSRADAKRPFQALAVACATLAAPAAILTRDGTSATALARAADQRDVFVFEI